MHIQAFISGETTDPFKMSKRTHEKDCMLKCKLPTAQTPQELELPPAATAKMESDMEAVW